MKIALAQVASEKGNTPLNIQTHLRLIHRCVSAAVDFVVFPELSVTGYEPTIADFVAMDERDETLEVFQQASDLNNMMLAVGVPIRREGGVTISMIIFSPRQSRRIYSKKYLHDDELPFFIPGVNFPELKVSDYRAALAVCYEISVPAHESDAFATKPDLYIASVVKSKRGIASAHERLQSLSEKYKIPVLMVNAVGVADGEPCAGQSAAWHSGQMISQLDSVSEDLLLFELDGEQIRSIKA